MEGSAITAIQSIIGMPESPVRIVIVNGQEQAFVAYDFQYIVAGVILCMTVWVIYKLLLKLTDRRSSK